MAVRVQVILSDHERERLRRQATMSGVSLSAWIRQAALARLASAEEQSAFKSADDLRSFFERCDQREEGREPEWEEHLAVIGCSKGSGASGT